MLRIQRSTCIHSDTCKDAPLYGVLRATHCEHHRLPTHLNLVERPCTDCGLLFALDENDKCCYCGVAPSEVARRRLFKQREVQAWLDGNGFGDYIVSDRKVSVPERDAGCTTAERPDFIWDFGTHFVVLEVDEFGHVSYKMGCDGIRMFNVGEDLMRPRVFIRYNPDSFKADGRKKNSSWSKRMDTLRRWLEFAKDPANVPHTLQMVQLFFDEYKQEEVSEFTMLREKQELIK